ncbi:ITGB1BP2 [Symbiodinium natans]|uniref:ITGB1BP2 protein n=1 Tax=Symbiodinium natans TaxID=878477 RepID=A0A812IGM2_9DINO|nr:ITGB1BP2 [Symbiodinium natans]
MKVTLKFEEASTEDRYMTLRLTLPQKYVNGANKEVVKLFVDHYNKKHAETPLSADELHLKIVGGIHLDNEERVRDSLSNGDECYLLGKDSEGPAPKRQEPEKGYHCTPAAPSTTTAKQAVKNADGKVRCKNFGCQKMFDPDGPPQECVHHKAAPIFHETAKWWSCCPDRKAYEFEEFMNIPGCTQGFCSSESQGKKAHSARDGVSESSQPERHLWPHSMRVLLDGVELVRVDPPDDQRRPDSPLKLRPPNKAGGHVFQLFAGAAPPRLMSGAANAKDFVLCLLVTRPRRSVADLLDECRQRSAIPVGASWKLLAELRQAEVGVRSNTPWQQPLRCPLTQERLAEPARGMHCQHLQCFELEAFLITAAAMPFQRRWRCPICDLPLQPGQLATCDLTRRCLTSGFGV